MKANAEVRFASDGRRDRLGKRNGGHAWRAEPRLLRLTPGRRLRSVYPQYQRGARDLLLSLDVRELGRRVVEGGAAAFAARSA